MYVATRGGVAQGVGGVVTVGCVGDMVCVASSYSSPSKPLHPPRLHRSSPFPHPTHRRGITLLVCIERGGVGRGGLGVGWVGGGVGWGVVGLGEGKQTKTRNARAHPHPHPHPHSCPPRMQTLTLPVSAQTCIICVAVSIARRLCFAGQPNLGLEAGRGAWGLSGQRSAFQKA